MGSFEGCDEVVCRDGKTFAEGAMVLALGITTTGEKRLLGFVQPGTENEKVCAAFLRELVERGLRYEQGLLCIIDGSKGLRKAVVSVFGALGTSLKTTNYLESLNALVGQRTDKVDYWRTSDQKHRWLAAALLDIEPRLRRIRGYGSLPLLRTALQTEIRGKEGRAEHRAA